MSYLSLSATALVLEHRRLRGWWWRGRAQNLIGLIIERDIVAVSPDAPQLKSFNVAAPKSKKIELYLLPGKIDRD